MRMLCIGGKLKLAIWISGTKVASADKFMLARMMRKIARKNKKKNKHFTFFNVPFWIKKIKYNK
jgi:hypothetical protein